MGWTRYEQLARHVDVNCTGKTEDSWELPLMTNTITANNLVDKNLNKMRGLTSALHNYINKILAARPKDKNLLTRGHNSLDKTKIIINKSNTTHLTNLQTNLHPGQDISAPAEYKSVKLPEDEDVLPPFFPKDSKQQPIGSQQLIKFYTHIQLRQKISRLDPRTNLNLCSQRGHKTRETKTNLASRRQSDRLRHCPVSNSLGRSYCNSPPGTGNPLVLSLIHI